MGRETYSTCLMQFLVGSGITWKKTVDKKERTNHVEFSDVSIKALDIIPKGH